MVDEVSVVVVSVVVVSDVVVSSVSVSWRRSTLWVTSGPNAGEVLLSVLAGALVDGVVTTAGDVDGVVGSSTTVGVVASSASRVRSPPGMPNTIGASPASERSNASIAVVPRIPPRPSMGAGTTTGSSSGRSSERNWRTPARSRFSAAAASSKVAFSSLVRPSSAASSRSSASSSEAAMSSLRQAMSTSRTSSSVSALLIAVMEVSWVAETSSSNCSTGSTGVAGARVSDAAVMAAGIRMADILAR